VLKGEYYASIFVHYKPADEKIWDPTKYNLEVTVYNNVSKIM